MSTESEMPPLEELLRAIGDDDPEDLEAIGIMREMLDTREEELVLKARVEGWPWSRIADALGLSEQAVREKYRDPQDRHPFVRDDWKSPTS